MTDMIVYSLFVLSCKCLFNKENITLQTFSIKLLIQSLVQWLAVIFAKSTSIFEHVTILRNICS